MASKYSVVREPSTGNFYALDVLLDIPYTVKLKAGGKFEVQDHTGAPIFRVNEDGSLQGLTGQTLTFNL